jgi:hypothetical protein
MRPAHRLVAITAILAGAVGLFAGHAIAAQPDSPGAPVSDPRFSGPGVDISVTIPAGWHQIGDYHQIPQMVYPQTCSVGIECAFAGAELLSDQERSAQIAAEAFEQGLAGSPGIQGVTVTNEGPVQVAGRPGYYVRFTYSKLAINFQAEAAAVETGPTTSDGVRTSLVFVTVSDVAGAPPASVIDQIVGSAQLKAH